MVTVAEFIADFLYKEGVRDIFMLSGAGAIHLDQAVANHKGLREVCIKNEATGPMMAKAYAQTRNGLGAVYVTTGPGGANAVTGVVECFVDSSPVIIISGQAPVTQTTHHARIPGLRSFGVQELNIVDVVKSITKYAKMVTHAESIQFELQKAVYLAKQPRSGPVWLDIPLDIQSTMIDPTTLEKYNPPFPFTEMSTPKIDRLIDELQKSERPLILAGQGVRDSVTDLIVLAERIDTPIILSRMGLDMLSLTYKYNMGIGGFKGLPYNKKIMRDADLVIAIGTSLSVAFAGHDLSFLNPTAKVFMVDIENAEARKFLRRLHSFINCDAHEFLVNLNRRLVQRKIELTHPHWIDDCIYLKSPHVVAPERNPIDIYYLVKRIDYVSNEKDIFVDDAGSIYYVASQMLRFDRGQREVTSGAFASMGNAIPLAIGAAIANRDMRILAMTGDGSLETNVQELKTLSYYDLNVKLFVINNGGYISMRDHGRDAVGEQNSILNLKKVAEAFDMHYSKIEDYRELDYLHELIGWPGPQFIEVICDPNQKLILP